MEDDDLIGVHILSVIASLRCAAGELMLIPSVARSGPQWHALPRALSPGPGPGDNVSEIMILGQFFSFFGPESKINPSCDGVDTH